MDIIYKKGEQVEFRTLTSGDVFRYNEATYMRIQEISNEEDYYYNAVELKTGYVECFEPEDWVELVDAKLTIS